MEYGDPLPALSPAV
jgi:hypothetical protein